MRYLSEQDRSIIYILGETICCTYNRTFSDCLKVSGPTTVKRIIMKMEVQKRKYERVEEMSRLKLYRKLDTGKLCPRKNQ